MPDYETDVYDARVIILKILDSHRLVHEGQRQLIRVLQYLLDREWIEYQAVEKGG